MRFHLAIPAIFAVASLCFGNGCSGGGGESDVSGPADSEWFDVVSDEGTEDAGIEDAGLDARPDQGGQDVGEADNGQGESYPNACRGFDQPSGTSCTGTSAVGCCDDLGRVVWCQDNSLYCFDCNLNPKDSQSCGWRVVEKFAGYDCGGSGADPAGIFPLECGDTCIPDCKGRDCGSDGCGGYCGTCGEGLLCESGRCVQPGAEYPDVCRGFQEPSGGTCPGYISTYGCCDAQGRVVWCDRGRIYCNDCSRNPAPQNSCGWFEMEAFRGYDCGGSGEDPEGLAIRECGATCQPECDGAQCGPDGCGGLCGTCVQDRICSAGQCVVPAGGVLTGSLKYQVILPEYDGTAVNLGQTVVRDAARVPVAVVDSSGAVIGRASVGEDGTFRVGLEKALKGGETLVVTAGYMPAGLMLVAVLRPEPVVEPGSFSSPMWSWSMPVTGMDVGTKTITVEQGSGAIHVFRMAVLGMDRILEHLAKTTYGLPGLALLWAPDAPWSVGLAFGKVAQKIQDGPYMPQSIFVGGGDGTSGPWGEAVILHEFGHYITNNFTKHDSPGGSHYVGELISPPFAWAEAFSNFFGVSTQSQLAGAPNGRMWLIVDYGKGAKAGWWIDYASGTSTVGGFKQPVAAEGMTQYLDENYLTSMLWDLWDGLEFADDDADGTALGTGRFLKAMVTDRFLDMNRGAVGVDFVDFVDSVLCAEPGLKTSVTATIKDFLKFPYDGQPSCPASAAVAAVPVTMPAQAGGVSAKAAWPRNPSMTWAMGRDARFGGDASLDGSLRPPLQVEVSGVKVGDEVVLTATVTVTPGLRSAPILALSLPEGATLVKGAPVERLDISQGGMVLARTFRVRALNGQVVVAVSAGDDKSGAMARAAWPALAEVRSSGIGLARPFVPAVIDGVRHTTAIPF